jgi:hypothetical protein
MLIYRQFHFITLNQEFIFDFGNPCGRPTWVRQSEKRRATLPISAKEAVN